MPPAKSLADRIADTLRSLVGEGAAELEQRLAEAVREAAGSGDGKEGRRESAFEEAARRVGESLLDWRRGRSLLRYVQETGRDRITSVGDEVELMVKVEALFRGGLELHGRTVRFFVEGEPAGEARTDEHGVAFLPFAPETTGLHWVTYEVVSEAGRVQRSMREGECGWLQVVRDEPVAVVDADLLHDRPPEELEPLRELARRGWEVCYLDLHDEDRTEAMRETLQREALPMGALLVHPKDDRGFHALDVDFRPVLAVTSLRRLRSHGVAAVLYVCDDERAAERSAQDGVAACSLAGLRAALEDGAEIERIEGAAREFRAERSAPGDGGFTRRLDVLTGSRLLRGNAVSLEFDNRKAREALFSAIEGAER
ncbi:MAG: hypothetical protein K8I02_09275, partial [Candidatus Methylomirabilis sp.]|nr:hypothetical protein [Deltaproteobacteria bacterium]